MGPLRYQIVDPTNTQDRWVLVNASEVSVVEVFRGSQVEPGYGALVEKCASLNAHPWPDGTKLLQTSIIMAFLALATMDIGERAPAIMGFPATSPVGTSAWVLLSRVETRAKNSYELFFEEQEQHPIPSLWDALTGEMPSLQAHRRRIAVHTCNFFTWKTQPYRGIEGWPYGMDTEEIPFKILLPRLCQQCHKEPVFRRGYCKGCW